MPKPISRRSIIASSVLVASAGLTAKVIAKGAEPSDAQTSGAQPLDTQPLTQTASSDVLVTEAGFQYSYVKTDEQWRAQLSELEYGVLREGRTEKRKSSPLWKEMRAGHYNCKGCDLRIYSSDYKVKLNKGWTFFRQSEPDSVLMGIDFITEYGGKEKNETAIEAHCRRCGSHFGHVLYIKGEILHCINGAALTFTAA